MILITTFYYAATVSIHERHLRFVVTVKGWLKSIQNSCDCSLSRKSCPKILEKHVF